MSTLEMVQRRSAHRLLHDYSRSSVASVLVAQLQLDKLQSRRTSDKVCMMDTIMAGLVNVNLATGLLEPRTTAPEGINTNSKSPTPEQTRSCSRTSHHNPTLEHCPHRCSISRHCVCLQTALTVWMEGRGLSRKGSVIC